MGGGAAAAAPAAEEEDTSTAGAEQDMIAKLLGGMWAYFLFKKIITIT